MLNLHATFTKGTIEFRLLQFDASANGRRNGIHVGQLNGELVFCDATFDQAILDAYKLSVAVKVSEELLSDNAYDLESFLIDSFGRAIANAEEEAFLIGDGSSKPTGIFHAAKGGQIGMTAASDKAITADEVVDLAELAGCKRGRVGGQRRKPCKRRGEVARVIASLSRCECC
jgi:predicted phage gp36 major capsid-like protein